LPGPMCASPTPLTAATAKMGALYRATFDAALTSNPDWLLLSSFNEWVEGTYIEPGVQYGDKYLELTKEFVTIFKDK
ncbi:MAG: hypothetical protein HC875_35645, partial [Anaerolineales bacterium]|nr:hypothetical protein [Anaerolineales bacterium]